MNQVLALDRKPYRSIEWRLEKEIIAQQVRDIINSYIVGLERIGSKKNLVSLARDFELSDRSLRSILNEGKIPQVKTVLKIFKVISGIDSNQEIVNYIPSPTKDWVLESKLYDSLKNNISSSHTINTEYEKNKVLAVIYDLSVDSGVSKEEVIKTFGEYGIIQLQKLVDASILIEENHLYVRTNNKIQRSDIAEKNRLMNLCEHFVDPNEFKTLDANSLRVTCYDLSPEQYQYWIYEIENCYKKLNLIGESVTNEQRTIKASAGLFATTILKRGQNEIQ